MLEGLMVVNLLVVASALAVGFPVSKDPLNGKSGFVQSAVCHRTTEKPSNVA
jgi:hypothetical protein